MIILLKKTFVMVIPLLFTKLVILSLQYCVVESKRTAQEPMEVYRRNVHLCGSGLLHFEDEAVPTLY